jgi:hypothetical protein
MGWDLFKKYYVWIFLFLLIIAFSKNIDAIAENELVQEISTCVAILVFSMMPINIIRYQEYPRGFLPPIKGKYAVVFGVICLLPIGIAEVSMLLSVYQLLTTH